MREVAYRLTREHEATHWWFLARRDLALLQVRRAARELGFPSAELRLLDYGCGTGFNLEFLSAFGETSGADVCTSEQLAHWRAAGRPLIDLSSDTKAFEQRFDILTALDVLEHIADDVDGLRRMASFVRPGGRLILTVPAYRWLWSGEDVISHHYRRYTKETLLAACRAAGLGVLYLSHFNLTILPAMAAVIAAKKVIFRGRDETSSMSAVPEPINQLLYRLTALEARMVGEERRALPIGPSLVCRLERPA